MRFFCPLLSIGILALLAGMACGEEVENPAYAAWAKCQPGAHVTRMITDHRLDGSFTKRVTETLVAVKPEGIEIEVKQAWEGEAAQTTKVVILPKIQKGKEFLPLGKFPAEAAVTYLKEGKETITVNGKKIEAATYACKVTFRADPTGAVTHENVTYNATFWWSPEVPGGLVRYELNGTSFLAASEKMILTTDDQPKTQAASRP